MEECHVTWRRGTSGSSAAARCGSGVSCCIALKVPREHSGGPMPLAVWIVAVVAVSVALAYLNSSGWLWIAAGAGGRLPGLIGGALPMAAFLVLGGIFAFGSVGRGVAPLRRVLVS